MSIIAPIAEGALAAFIACMALVLLWIAWCETARAWDRRRKRNSRPPHRCPCGCGRPIRHVPGRPVDGRPLDDYEKRHLALVLLGYLNSPDDDSASVREDHQ